MATKPAYLRCKDGFVLPDRTVVKAGQVVSAGDRVVKLAPACFEPVEGHIESATQAPNERRLMPKRNQETVVLSAATKRNRRRNAKPVEEVVTEAEQEVVEEVVTEETDG
jgi:hypothetical protein